MTNGSATTTFTYEANGATLGRSGSGETLTYGWDAAVRLARVTRNGMQQAAFAYDGDRNRSAKTNGAGQATTYVPGIRQYDASRPTETARWAYSLSNAQNARLVVDGAGAVGRHFAS